MARFLLWFLAVVVLAVSVAAGTFIWFRGAVATPGPLQSATTVIITPGARAPAIARDLANAHVIANPFLLEMEARVSGKARALRPGEYRFDPRMSIAAVIDKIVRHDVVSRFVTVPEGLTREAVLRILAQAEGLAGNVTSQVDEGDLLPETYRYEWGDTREAVISRMRAARESLVKQLWETRAPDLPLHSPEEAVILASIVEKETGIAAERPHVAAVFLNRLRRGMKLQSDPTVIYGLTQSAELARPLSHADLEQPTPYNTYVIDGLPPGPICNPGKAAIQAVLAPLQSDDLYFVADGSGGHVFAATLEEHNRNVAHWRKVHDQKPQ